MRFRSSIRVLLALVAASGLAAIAWSVLSRGEGGRLSSGELLDPGIARESTDFEHVEYKRGQAVFRVSSKVDTLTEVGEHRLSEVRLTVYGKEGETTDWVAGRSARYVVEEKKIEFQGDVEAALSDGTLLFSDRLQADLEKETVSVREDFRFRRGEARGSGRSLLYEIGPRRLRIGADFRMENPDSEAPFSVSAASGDYDLASAGLTLREGVRLTGRDYRLSGAEMRIQLTPERRVERIEDVGEASFVSGGRSFAGGRIILLFDVQTARLREFQVLEGEGAAASARAVFEQRTPRGSHRLQADRIVGVPNAGARDAGGFQLETFQAEGGVLFVSPGLGIDRAASSRLEGAFDGRGNLRQMDMFGGVTVERTLGDRTDRLKSRRLRLVFDQSQRLQRGSAYSDAQLSLSEPGLSRTLSAGESVVMDFREGLVSRVTASGGCLLDTLEDAVRSQVRAPSMLALFSDGVVDRLFAGDGVRVDLRNGDSEQSTESLQLRLLYENGKLRRAIQSGGFRYSEKGVGRRVELEADEAVFRPRDDRIVAVGRSPQPKLVQTSADEAGGESVSETRADRFEIRRDGGGVVAEGGVASRWADSRRPFRIVAGKMTADPAAGVVVYSLSPRLEEGESHLTGKVMTWRDEDQTLSVDGQVDSFISSRQDDKLTSYRISADRARIRRAENKAVYEGQVGVRSEEMSLKAPFLELRFGDDGFGQLREAVARGGVLIEDPTRRAVGDTAYYEPAEKKVRVLGGPAEVVDSKQGRATGAELVFFLGDERILIEGPVKRQP